MQFNILVRNDISADPLSYDTLIRLKRRNTENKTSSIVLISFGIYWDYDNNAYGTHTNGRIHIAPNMGMKGVGVPYVILYSEQHYFES